MLIKHNANFWWLTVPVASILSQDSLTWVKSTKVRQISRKIEKKKKTEAKSYLLFILIILSTVFLLKCGAI